MNIIAIANQKGGQAKTVTTVQLAQALVRRRPRRGRDRLAVLVIDLDAQKDATDQLYPGLDQVLAERAGAPPAPGTSPAPAPGTFEVLTGASALADVVVQTPGGPWLCPASAGLSGLDVLLGTRHDGPRRLRAALQASSPPRWDFVLMDCPPALSMATVNALVAADVVLHPLMPEDLAVKAVGPLSGSIGLAVQHNPRLRHLGFLLTRVSLAEGLTEEVRQQLRALRLPEAGGGTPLWKTFIPVDAKLKRLQAPRGKGVRAYEAAAEELIERLGRLARERCAS